MAGRSGKLSVVDQTFKTLSTTQAEQQSHGPEASVAGRGPAEHNRGDIDPWWRLDVQEHHGPIVGDARRVRGGQDDRTDRPPATTRNEDTQKLGLARVRLYRGMGTAILEHRQVDPLVGGWARNWSRRSCRDAAVDRRFSQRAVRGPSPAQNRTVRVLISFAIGRPGSPARPDAACPHGFLMCSRGCEGQLNPA